MKTAKPTLFFLFLPACWAGASSALTLDLPAAVLAEETRSETFGSYGLPTGAFDGTTVPVRAVEGALDQRALQLDAPGITTLAILAPLREQITAAGYSVTFECEARDCGGFDFRYGTDVLPEPDMHVDLGDFRFLSAEKGDEAVSLLVSRSARTAYLQITHVTAKAPTDVPDPASPVIAIDLDAEQVRGIPVAGAAGDELAAALDANGSAPLDDLVFPSGGASLTEGDYASLAGVAAWLQANPDGTIAVVGHTDASGSLTANIALSERRAEAVAEVLIDSYGADRNRIAAEGVGFLSPRATNQTEDGRQKNRRVEVIVTSTR